MGYNGHNRKGYDVRYRGLQKSAMVPGDRLLEGTSLLGLLGVTKFFEKTPSPGELVTDLATADFTRGENDLNSRLSQKGVSITVGLLLAFVAPFQYLCFYSYQWWGWWPFFSFLVFGSLALLCIGVAEITLDTSIRISPSRWNLLAWCILIMTIADIGFGLWPFWLVEWDGFVLVHGLVLCQDIVGLIILLYLHGASRGVKQIERG